jgi:hypothetical protein
MCRKLAYLTSFVSLLGLVCNAMGQTGTGLRGEYFHFTAPAPPPREEAFRDLVLARIDATIDFYWNPGPDPPPGVRPDNFAVRWTGELEALNSEAYTFTTGSDDGVRLYLNGELIIENWTTHDRTEDSSAPVQLVAGQRYPIVLEGFEGGGEAEWQLYWESASTPREVVPQRVLYPAVKVQDFPASEPIPADGAILKDTWFSMEWTAGAYATLHDVYLGENSDDVDAGSGGTFQINQSETSFFVGLSGYPYPEGLVSGTTYYWRIDEVNDLDPDSPWKGPVWSFTIAPRTAFGPSPADGGEGVDPNGTLSWEPGFDARLHFVYFGDDYDTVSNAAAGSLTGPTFYSPGTMESAKVHYWRIDESDGVSMHKGEVWSFTTAGAVGSPNPPYGAENVGHTQVLTWVAGDDAGSHQVYFGTDKDAVRNATTASPEYRESKGLGTESYDPGLLEWNTNYYWRIDEVNNLNPNSPWKGNVWPFTTAGFFVVDDFESYNDIDPPNPLSNTIFPAWPDGYTTPATNGALVGNDLPPYAEQNTVHGGNQSMPYSYDANLKYSEATHTLTYPRNWTEKGAEKLTLWFKGDWINVAVPMYVTITDTTGAPAVAHHDDPDATRLDVWTEWSIPLQAFADQNVDLTDVITISIGFGNKTNPQAGGSGKMYFDDIRLYRPGCVPDEVTLSEADLNSDCVVDYKDLEIMVGDWLAGVPGLAADLNADDTVDFKDYAVLADQWLDEALWP